MSEHNFHQDEWLYLIKNQINSSFPERIEILPVLRARFGNLLHEEIASVTLEYRHSSYWILILRMDEPTDPIKIDSYVSITILEHSEQSPIDRLMDVICEWVTVLDDYRAARDFEVLFTHHAFELIERVGNMVSSEQDDELQKEQSEKTFYSDLTLEMAEELAPAINKKIQAIVRSHYKTSPAFDMVSEDCSNEWQEMGAMLFDGSHLLLDTGISQLERSVSNAIRKLSRAERLALWCKYGDSIDDVIEEFVCNQEPGDSFDLTNDRDNLDLIVTMITQDLQDEMTADWEKQLSEIENDETDDEDETN